jgi:hypothetical protein
MVWQFKNGMVCLPATSEAGARRPRSSANYSDSSSVLAVAAITPRLSIEFSPFQLELKTCDIHVQISKQFQTFPRIVRY